jgi:hypothetical protein
MRTPEVSVSESLASQLIAMTWSKQYTATVGISDVDTDGGVSMQTVLDELFMTWLPSRGWTTHQQATPPTPGSGTAVYYWFEKQVQCIDNSYYNHRIEFAFDPAATENFAYGTWEDGVAPDTILPVAAFTDTLNTGVEGVWEFWTSDQDNDSFAILNKGVNNSVIGFMPPAGSIWPSGTWFQNYPTKNGPVFPCAGFNWWSAASTYGAVSPYLNFVNSSYNANFDPGSVKLNFAAVKAGLSSSSTPAFLTTTNDVNSIVNLREGTSGSAVNVPNTMLIDGDYYIALGQTSNKILLNTGTVDPQF